LFMICLLFSLIAGCEFFPLAAAKEASIAQTSLTDIEKKIRDRYDPIARYSYSEYEALLACLDDEKFEVVSLLDMNVTEDPSKVIVGLRHDVDRHPFKAVEMALMEKKHGFGASYYILPNAYYAGAYVDGQYQRYQEMGEVYQRISSQGMEIGIHNDLLTMQLSRDIDPVGFNAKTVEYFQSLGIATVGSVAHGSPLMRQLALTNYYVFSDFVDLDPQKRRKITWNDGTYELGTKSMAEFGFQYEANFVNKNVYISDAGGNWKYTVADTLFKGVDTVKIIEVLRNSIPGDRIQILTHPVWWGKS